jgi:hypothetical protein
VRIPAARGVACVRKTTGESIPPSIAGPPCPGCGGSLDLIQPRPDDPAHLLGCCTACPLWFLVVVDVERDGLVATAVCRLSRADAVLLRRTG